MSSFRHDPSEDGLDRIRLQNRHVDVTVVPAAGGKIIDLIDRRSGRNWLWHNPHIPLSRANRSGDFNREQDSGGWDEILLSIKPGKIASVSDQFQAVPDHGDLIGCEWSVDELQVTAAGDVVCDMSAIGGSAPYRFKRQIRLPKREPLVEMTYSLTNDGDEPLPYFWCAHPLLAVEPDTSINIQGSMPLRVDDAATRQHVAAEVEQHWPKLLLRDGKSFDLSQSFTVNGAQRSFASKIFVRSPETGVASVLLGGNGARLTFRFDPAELPWLGIWINNDAWSGCGSKPYTNLGIEPATTPYDCVNQAIENDAVSWLQPGNIRNWSLSVELQA